MTHAAAVLLAAGETHSGEALVANGTFTLIAWLIGIPLVSAALLLLGGRRTDRWGHWLATAAALATAVIAVVLLIGIATSVFTAVVFTRMMVATWLRRARPTSLHI